MESHKPFESDIGGGGISPCAASSARKKLQTIRCFLCGSKEIYPGPKYEEHLINKHEVLEMSEIDFLTAISLFKPKHGSNYTIENPTNTNDASNATNHHEVRKIGEYLKLIAEQKSSSQSTAGNINLMQQAKPQNVEHLMTVIRSLEKKNKDLKHNNKSVIENKDEIIRNKEEIIRQNEEIIRHKNEELREKDDKIDKIAKENNLNSAIIARKDEEIKEKDDKIDKMIKEKNFNSAIITGKDEEIKEKDKIIRNKTQAATILEERVSELERCINTENINQPSPSKLVKTSTPDRGTEFLAFSVTTSPIPNAPNESIASDSDDPIQAEVKLSNPPGRGIIELAEETIKPINVEDTRNELHEILNSDNVPVQGEVKLSSPLTNKSAELADETIKAFKEDDTRNKLHENLNSDEIQTDVELSKLHTSKLAEVAVGTAIPLIGEVANRLHEAPNSGDIPIPTEFKLSSPLSSISVELRKETSSVDAEKALDAINGEDKIKLHDDLMLTVTSDEEDNSSMREDNGMIINESNNRKHSEASKSKPKDNRAAPEAVKKAGRGRFSTGVGSVSNSKFVKLEPEEYVPLGKEFSTLITNTERSARSKSETNLDSYKTERKSSRIANTNLACGSRGEKIIKNISSAVTPINFISAGFLQDKTKSEADQSSKNQLTPMLNEHNHSINKDVPHKSEKTYLQEMCDTFKNDKRKQEYTLKRRIDNHASRTKSEQTAIIQKIESIWTRWISSNMKVMQEIIKTVANMCTEPEFKGEGNVRILVQILYQKTRDGMKHASKSPLEGNVSVVENQSMSKHQCQLLTFILMLQKSISSENSGQIDIVSQLVSFIYNSIFGKARDNQPSMRSFKMQQLTNLTNMLITLLRYKGDESTAKTFLYDVLFFRTTRSHVLISSFLDAWPEVMQYRPSTNVVDPLLETIIWLIYNTGDVKNLIDAKVLEARTKVEKICRFPNPRSSKIGIYQLMIQKAEESFHDDNIKIETIKALVLLAKNLTWKWCHNNIIKTLLDKFQQWKIMCLESDSKEVDKSKPQQLLTWVVDCIGNVSRVYPAEGRERLLEIFNPIKGILTDQAQTHLLTADLEESCLRALIWTGHHLQVQVAEFLISWKPKHPQSHEVIELVKNFVGTRGEKYCNTTIKVWKKKELYETLNAKVSH